MSCCAEEETRLRSGNVFVDPALDPHLLRLRSEAFRERMEPFRFISVGQRKRILRCLEV